MSDRRVLSDITLVLVATASILIDRSLQSKCTRDRLCCQVWLWLCASLSNHSQRSTFESSPSSLVETWVYAILFSNIVPIVVERSIAERQKPRQSTSQNEVISYKAVANDESSGSPEADPKGIEVVSWLLAPSAWISLIATVFIVHRPTPDHSQQLNPVKQQQCSLLIFLFSFCILWGVQWRQRLLRRREADLQGIPISNPSQYTKSSGCCGGFASTTSGHEMTQLQHPQYGHPQESQLPDEYIWYTWSPAQVLEWISHIIKEQEYNDDPTLQQEIIISTLSPHHISGRILDHLSLSELRSLDIPYGPACEISIQIKRLVSNHPKPNILQDIAASHSSPVDNTPLDWTKTKPSSTTADCLTLHDEQYNRSMGSGEPLDSRYTGKELLTAMFSRKEPVPPSSSTVETAHFVDGNTAETAQHKVQEIMKARFGLELPKLRTSSIEANPDDDNNNSKMDFMPGQRAAPSEAQVGGYGLMQSTRLSGVNGAFPSVAMTTNTDPTSSQQPVETADFLNKILPEEVWKDMPPHIQEIAQRNPGIVQHLISQKQQQLVRQTPKDVEDTAVEDHTHRSGKSIRVSSQPDEYPDKSYQQGSSTKPAPLLVESDDPSSFTRESEIHRHFPLDTDIHDDPSTTPLINDHLQDICNVPNSSNADDERTNLLQHRKRSNPKTHSLKKSNYWAIDPS